MLSKDCSSLCCLQMDGNRMEKEKWRWPNPFLSVGAGHISSSWTGDKNLKKCRGRPDGCTSFLRSSKVNLRKRLGALSSAEIRRIVMDHDAGDGDGDVSDGDIHDIDGIDTSSYKLMMAWGWGWGWGWWWWWWGGGWGGWGWGCCWWWWRWRWWWRWWWDQWGCLARRGLDDKRLHWISKLATTKKSALVLCYAPQTLPRCGNLQYFVAWRTSRAVWWPGIQLQ